MVEELKKEPGLFKGVMLAYFILILHVILAAAMGLLVIFFRGVIMYMPWIFLGGATIILTSSYVLYRKLKSQGKSLWETLNSPMLQGKSFEVSLLGGLASFKVGREDHSQITIAPVAAPPRLEDATSMRLRELTELARLLENDLITPEEYNRVKRRIFS
jgi:hypothetical protein